MGLDRYQTQDGAHRVIPRWLTQMAEYRTLSRTGSPTMSSRSLADRQQDQGQIE